VNGRPLLRIGHSPDPDDAFMWWPLSEPGPVAEDAAFRYEPVLRDIETLNHDALRGELEITALSAAAYPFVAQRYALTSCGSSLGDQYGPAIIARRPMALQDLRRRGAVLAVPGEHTSAFAATAVLLGSGTFRHRVVPFDRIVPAVAAGEFDAGLVIHEGQVTFAQAGLHLVADLGMAWSSRCGLPLPLGVNAIRRDLDELYGPGTSMRVAGDLLASIGHALRHREAGLDRAMRHTRGGSREQVSRFVGMYVNRWTLDLGPVGRAAVNTLLSEARRIGLVPDPGPMDFITPAPQPQT
jgi:1,4-dihydroxy-6-naphthoate synthase